MYSIDFTITKRASAKTGFVATPFLLRAGLRLLPPPIPCRFSASAFLLCFVKCIHYKCDIVFPKGTQSNILFIN